VTSRVKSRSNRHLMAPLTWEEIMALVRLMVWVCAQVTTRIYVYNSARSAAHTCMRLYETARMRHLHVPYGVASCAHACGLQIF
jgi:hypothetical protein